MAYENRNAAYDLSLFDDDIAYSNGSAAPKKTEQEVHKKQTKRKTDPLPCTLFLLRIVQSQYW